MELNGAGEMGTEEEPDDEHWTDNDTNHLTEVGGVNDTDYLYIPYASRPETYIVPILFAVIFVIGILGNGTLISIFIKNKTMRNVPNMYIVSLAVGDLLVILFCVPFTSTVYTVDSWPYGEFVCKFSEFIKDMSIGISVFTLTALSADRYFAIADPMRKLYGRRATRITCLTIAGIWLLSIGFAVPSALFSYVKAMEQDPHRIFYVCYPFPPYLGDTYPKVVVMFRFLVYYAIPLGFIGTFYIIMARHLVQSTRNFTGESQGQAKQMQGRRKVAKMILSFVVIFAICFFPSHLFLMWFYLSSEAEDDYNDFWHACRITGFCLSFINSCINPITLYCVSGTFRKKYNEHLFCCCSCHNRGDEERRGGGGGPGGVVGVGTGGGDGQRKNLLLGGEGFACGMSLTALQMQQYSDNPPLPIRPNNRRNNNGQHLHPPHERQELEQLQGQHVYKIQSRGAITAGPINQSNCPHQKRSFHSSSGESASSKPFANGTDKAMIAGYGEGRSKNDSSSPNSNSKRVVSAIRVQVQETSLTLQGNINSPSDDGDKEDNF